MKLITILLLVFISSTSYGQYINGPANLRDKPNGEILFSVNDYVRIELRGGSEADSWYHIFLSCKVKHEALINKTTIKSNSTLFSHSGDSIGYTLKEFNVYENQNQNYRKYDELKMILVFLDGYTYKSNLRDELTKEEILNNKPSYTDSFKCSIVQYQDEDGLYITKIEQCNYYNPLIKINGNYEDAIVKEIQRIKRSSGLEGQESTIELEIVTNCFSDLPNKRNFVAEADKIDIEKNIIKTIKYGCCDAEDECQLYNIKAFKKLMDFDKVLYHVEIPNSRIEGFIGFKFSAYDKNKTDIGTITFSSPDSIINKVKIVTHDKNKFETILRFVPEMEFETTNDKDKVDYNKTALRLWSKNKSEYLSDISGFNFLIHFLNDGTGEDFTQKLEFKNGFINGNPNKEFEFIME